MNDMLKDVKPPVDLPNQWMWFVVLFIVTAALALIIWLVYRYFKRPAKPQSQAPFPLVLPWEKAYSRLNDLLAKGLMQQADLKLFYSELSDIIRHYLEERFSLRAPEMTTEEFLDSLRVSQVLNDQQKQTLKDFLWACDMVKFAKHQPGVNEAQKSFDLAKQLIGQTHGT